MANSNAQSKLKKIVDQLPAAQQQQLLEFAQFLSERHETVAVSPVPLNISRPDDETVVAALKRLRETYPMLDQEVLLQETSDQVGKHMMQGKSAKEVIDELEKIFKQQYNALDLEP